MLLRLLTDVGRGVLASCRRGGGALSVVGAWALESFASVGAAAVGV